VARFVEEHSMFAIIKSGGKQYRVSQGEVLRLESLAAEPGDVVELPVLMTGGDSVRVGKPFVEGAVVKAEVLGHGRGPKLHIYKFKAKANYRRKTGHRQPYTEVRITGLEG
jgi:large subunit ribosomal protein L21